MQDVTITWQEITAFFGGIAVFYKFAIGNAPYYIKVISGKVFLVLCGLSFTVYTSYIFTEAYNKILVEKLGKIPTAPEIVINSWKSISASYSYIFLFLTCCFVAWFFLEILIRSMEDFKKKQNS